MLLLVQHSVPQRKVDSVLEPATKGSMLGEILICSAKLACPGLMLM